MAELGARGMRFAIATPHRAATRAGLDAFDAGGTAVDAALAAAVTLAVVYPHMCGVGGDLFALVREPDAAAGDANTAGRIVAVNASGASPAALDVQELRRVLLDEAESRGPSTITIPGAVSGWAALARWSTLGLARAIEPAIGLARDSVPVAGSLALGLATHRDLVLTDPGLAELFAPEGRPLEEGSTLRQPALARTLEAIASGGPEVLYGGEVGARLIEGLHRLGSAITVEDLARHEAILDSPLVGRYLDLDVAVCPPNSQGFVLLQTLAMVERLGIDPDPLGPDAVTLAEIHRVAASDRDRHNADPMRLRVPVGELLEDGHLAAQCEQVRARAVTGATRLRGDTVALVAADAEGRAVSIVESLSSGFGSGILEPSTGILLQNRGGGFSPDPDSPNAAAGGVRPAHTLMPAIVQRGDRLLAAAGTMGGGAQPQIVASALIRALELGMTPAEALDAPRYLVGGMDFPVGERFVEMEARVPDPVRRALGDDGYRVVPLDGWDEGTGHAHVIVAEPDGSLVAGTDPRADGEAGTR
jgi:gamma-glutamyltranspeptidase/glutathione hydrolase